MRQWIEIVEGGDTFRDTDDSLLTSRISQTDIPMTLRWLEDLLGMDLAEKLIGTTGRKSTSGDIDIAIDEDKFSKKQLIERLTHWCNQGGFKVKEFIGSSGNTVHFRAPITGNPDRGWVHVDFVFVPDPGFSKFMLVAPVDSKYTGKDRNVLLAAISKALGYSLNLKHGLIDPRTKKLVTSDPLEIAKILLNRRATVADLESVETIMTALETDSDREKKLKFDRSSAKESFAESAETDDEIHFLARLRDRIVNQGMVAIFEDDRGKRTRGIDHLEDLVFRRGTSGIKNALEVIESLAKNASTCASVKFDGSIALVFGRDPSGKFILTDASGFGAQRYDGLFTSPDQWDKRLRERDEMAIQRGKSGDRISQLSPIIHQLWPILKKSVPQDFRGFIGGDLLYTQPPPEQRGNLVFTPNTITYRIPTVSDLGQRIRGTSFGIAIHTHYPEHRSPKEPLGRVNLTPPEGILFIEPITASDNVIPENPAALKDLKKLMQTSGHTIDGLFNPAELRQLQISDFPGLCLEYINSLVADPRIDQFSIETLLPGFIQWLQTATSSRKFANIREYLQSPHTNTDALVSAFNAFILLHQIKMDLLVQLDRQYPGGEGWVITTPNEIAKFVNRFDFSRKNRLKPR